MNEIDGESPEGSGDREVEPGRAGAEGTGQRSGAPRPGRVGSGARWRDPLRLGILIQICIALLLVSLLIYLLFPFFAAAQRLNLSTGRIVYVPIAVLVIVIFFARRIVRLVRRFRGEDA